MHSVFLVVRALLFRLGFQSIVTLYATAFALGAISVHLGRIPPLCEPIYHHATTGIDIFDEATLHLPFWPETEAALPIPQNEHLQAPARI